MISTCRNIACLQRKLVTSAVFLAVSVLVTAQTTAEKPSNTSDDPKIIELNPFVVSSKNESGYRTRQTLVGSRTAKELIQIPSSISIINKALIDDLNATTVGQVIQVGAAGVTMNETIRDAFSFRGFNTNHQLRNGVLKTSFKHNPMYDVERVEVIKGPGAMLLGNNTFLGGGVNFVSAVPTRNKSGDAQVTIGSNNSVRFAANVMGPLNESKGFVADYRVTVGALKGDTDKDIEEEDQLFLGGGLALYFGDSSRLFANAYNFRDNGYVYWEDFLDYNSTLGTASAPMNAVLNKYSGKSFSPALSKDAFWENEDTFVDVTFLTTLTDNLNVRLYYFGGLLNDVRRHVRGITIMSDNKTLVRQDIPLTIKNYANNIQADVNHKFKISKFTFDSTFGFDWSSAFNHQNQSVNTNIASLNTETMDFSADATYFGAARPGAGLPNSSQSSSRVRNFSYYLQENISLFDDKLILVGGLRWFEIGGFNRNYVSNLTTKRPDNSFRTHKYGIVFRPVASVSIYATDAANIYPGTGFTDRFASRDDLGGPRPDQQGKMKEYGIKVDHKFSDNLSCYGSLTYYDMALTNVATFGVLPEATIPGTLGNVLSAGDMSTGWELEYGLRRGNDNGSFDLIGTYTNSDSETAADRNMSAADFVSSKISLMGRYAWKRGSLKGLVLGATYFDQGRKRNANWWIDFPTTYNLFGSYSFKKNWSLQLNLNNITDKRYIVAVGATGLVQTVPGFDPRLSVKYKW